MSDPQPTTARPKTSQTATRRQPWKRWLIGLTVVNALAVLTLFVLLCFVSERWWVSAVGTYLPRLPFAFPSLALCVVTLLTMPRWSIVNGLASVVALVFVAGLCAPVERDPLPKDASMVLTFLTCNVQDCASHPERLLWEFQRIDPDILVLQEAKNSGQIAEIYADRQIIQRGAFWIISRYPVRFVEDLRTESLIVDSGRMSAVIFEVDHPAGTIQVVDVHCNTARWGLMELSWHSLVSGYGVDAFSLCQVKRQSEMSQLSEFCDTVARRMPTIIAGDFNTPSSSSMFTDCWTGYRNAFESAGWGYGYTSPCNTSNRWPSNTPWLRIDHILTTSDWAIHSAEIGHTNGSDHRLVWAEVSLRE